MPHLKRGTSALWMRTDMAGLVTLLVRCRMRRLLHTGEQGNGSTCTLLCHAHVRTQSGWCSGTLAPLKGAQVAKGLADGVAV